MGSISKERPTPRVRVDADLAEKLGWMDKKVSIRAMIRRGTQQVTTWFYSGQILPRNHIYLQPSSHLAAGFSASFLHSFVRAALLKGRKHRR